MATPQPNNVSLEQLRQSATLFHEGAHVRLRAGWIEVDKGHVYENDGADVSPLL